ncbi:hypothetical protein PV325_001168 [Microctonus aethiopoides]|uniref:HMG box domain-containing protein n=1 Tax=Microctonus aethiopoides TaxID=144406 RepID=A0AA39FAX7_9HYME|nr:hypothetical protein PV325_001168 [Microctonus aethiopoides]KAK0091174.1 hypothetical protein PV326_003627 [Microctonus aethiopoides]KAK0166051.1 hypothetical protein PV328_004504 [Microctonus aethiopoides]
MGNDGSTAKKSPTKDQRRERTPRSTDGSTSKPADSRKKKSRTSAVKPPRASGKGPTNPFLIFFLRVRSKKPNEHVTVIARKAGKAWARMTPNDRQKYVDLANAEKRRREGKPRKKQSKNKNPE